MTIKRPSTSGERPIVAEMEDLQQEMERLAGDGQWSELAAAMEHRDTLLSRVTGADRSQLFGAVLHSNDRVLQLVQTGRRGVAEQLTALRRGREATGLYDSHRAAGLVPEVSSYYNPDSSKSGSRRALSRSVEKDLAGDSRKLNRGAVAGRERGSR